MVTEIVEGFRRAVELILSGDAAVLDAALRSICVSGGATLLATMWSLPLGLIIGTKDFRCRRALKSFFSALLGIPPVGLGLILYLLLSRSGPFGVLRLLYTPVAIILGQAVLITPIAVSFTASAIESVDPEISSLAKTLGASEGEASLAALREALSNVILAIVASFNRAISELGIALMLGGNIWGSTRVLTTSIALETTRGNFELGIALTIILLLITLTLNLATNIIRRQ